jgi:hypothetical protein
MIRVLKRLKEEVRDKPVEKRRHTKLRLHRAEILELKKEVDRRSRADEAASHGLER